MEPPLLLTRQLARINLDRDLRARHAAGTVYRLRAGVYIDSAQWSGLDTDERYRVIVRAASAVSRPGTQFGCDSAAALWRLPNLARWPASAYVITPPAPGGTSRVGMIHRGYGLDESPVTIDGVTVTSLGRTLIDTALRRDFRSAVAFMDAGLRPPERGEFRHQLGQRAPSKEELGALVAARLPFRGSARVLRVIDFGDANCGSPRESLFRVHCRMLGLPAPQTQVSFRDEDGLIGYVDFYWPHLGLILEIDGASKYGDRRRFQRDLSIEELILAEKYREDRLRRVSRDFARPPMGVVESLPRLARFLAHHGLVPA